MSVYFTLRAVIAARVCGVSVCLGSARFLWDQHVVSGIGALSLGSARVCGIISVCLWDPRVSGISECLWDQRVISACLWDQRASVGSARVCGVSVNIQGSCTTRPFGKTKRNIR